MRTTPPARWSRNRWFYVSAVLGFLLLLTICTYPTDSEDSSPVPTPTPPPTASPVPTPTAHPTAASPATDDEPSTKTIFSDDITQAERRELALKRWPIRRVYRDATDTAQKYREFGELFGPDLLQKTVHTMEGATAWSMGDELKEWNLTPEYIANACQLLLSHGATVQGMDELLRLVDFKGAATLGAIVGGLAFEPNSIEVYCLRQAQTLNVPSQ